MVLIDLLKRIPDKVRLVITYQGKTEIFDDIEEVPLDWLFKNVELTRPFESVQMIWIE